MNLQDAINEYKKEIVTAEAESKKREAEQIARNEADTKEAFEEIGLTPDRIQDRTAYFDFDGHVYGFTVVRERGWRAFYRTIGTCPACGENLYTDRRSIELDNIGAAIVNPESIKAYHDCEALYRPAAQPESQTPAEKLLAALDEYMAAHIREY